MIAVSVLGRGASHSGSAAPPVVAVSAVTGEGCDHLLEFLAELVDQGAPIEVAMGPEESEALAWLYRHGRVVERHDDADGKVQVSVRLDAPAIGRFERLFPRTILRDAAE